MKTEERKKDELQTAWPGWSIWRSSGNSWMATRRGPSPVAPPGFFSPRGSLDMTLMERESRALAAALEKQAAIADEIEAFRNHTTSTAHALGAGCPLACLQLSPGTLRALSDHWTLHRRREPFTVGTLQDMVATADLSVLTSLRRAEAVDVRERLESLEPIEVIQR